MRRTSEARYLRRHYALTAALAAVTLVTVLAPGHEGWAGFLFNLAWIWADDA